MDDINWLYANIVTAIKRFNKRVCSATKKLINSKRARDLAMDSVQSVYELRSDFQTDPSADEPI